VRLDIASFGTANKRSPLIFPPGDNAVNACPDSLFNPIPPAIASLRCTP